MLAVTLHGDVGGSYQRPPGSRPDPPTQMSHQSLQMQSPSSPRVLLPVGRGPPNLDPPGVASVLVQLLAVRRIHFPHGLQGGQIQVAELVPLVGALCVVLQKSFQHWH